MNPSFVSSFRHPRTGAALTLRADKSSGGEVVEGALLGDGAEFPIAGGIPRFVPAENYAGSFGYQWNRFATTQLDSKSSWGNVSEKRFFEQTGWPHRMPGQRILEAGSGMGRFTGVMAGTDAEVCTFDYSNAIVANLGNNAQHAKVCFAQADIYEPPYEQRSFDKVLCVGVLQHCPSPARAFQSLVRFLKPGGEIVIDVYRLAPKCLVLGKYYLRPVTRRLAPETLERLVRAHVGWVYPLTGALARWTGRQTRWLSWMLAMADYRGAIAMSDETARELSLLDTFDMLAPAYDRPQTRRRVERWFREAGLVDVHIEFAHTGISARGKRPA